MYTCAHVINHYATEKRGRGRYSSTILYIDNGWRSVVSFTIRQLYPREFAPCTHWIHSLPITVKVPRKGGLEREMEAKYFAPFTL
jgi:hypothetical protein